MSLKTIIIGGGKGCRSLIGLMKSPIMSELKLKIVGVADIDKDAPGLIYAKEIGLKTFTNIQSALEYPALELIIEMTGQDEILQELYKKIKPGTKIIDHKFTQIFWELLNARVEQNWQLEELEKLEREIAKERAFLQQVFDSNSDLMVVLNKNKKIKSANASFYKFANISKEDAVGKKCFDIMKGTALDCNEIETDDAFLELFSMGKTQTFIRKTFLPYETHWEITRTGIFNSKGEVESILSTWHRITDKIILQREIESAEMKFKSFINSAKDWISIKDLEGRYVIANPITASAFDLNPEDFVGKKPHEILPEKLSKTITKHDKLVIESNTHQVYDEIIPIHGIDHHFQTLRFPLKDYRGEAIGVCTIARDVTKEIKLQEQLIQSEKLAALGKLAAGVAHEINNPLTGILAYAEDLAEEFQEDSVQRADLNVIIRETLRCRDIVRNLLDFSRQDTPKFQIIETNSIIEQSLNLVKKLPQFKDIEIQTFLSNKMPKIQSDPQQLVQVVLNFMLNAADAMKYKGKILVNSEYVRNTQKCVISVEDTGPGIPENLIDKIFEPFFSTKGTSGLGLAVSWGIVERHHGNIEVDISAEGGAIFRIILPCVNN